MHDGLWADRSVVGLAMVHLHCRIVQPSQAPRLSLRVVATGRGALPSVAQPRDPGGRAAHHPSGRQQARPWWHLAGGLAWMDHPVAEAKAGFVDLFGEVSRRCVQMFCECRAARVFSWA